MLHQVRRDRREQRDAGCFVDAAHEELSQAEVGSHRLDLFVAKQIVVELKAVEETADVHFAVVRSYLRAVDTTHGLILNFAKATLGVKRAIVQRAPSCTSCVP